MSCEVFYLSLHSLIPITYIIQQHQRIQRESILYNNTKEFRERERERESSNRIVAYDVVVAVTVKEAKQVEKAGHYPYKEKQREK